jgi:hypothetical protein
MIRQATSMDLMVEFLGLELGARLPAVISITNLMNPDESRNTALWNEAGQPEPSVWARMVYQKYYREITLMLGAVGCHVRSLPDPKEAELPSYQILADMNSIEVTAVSRCRWVKTVERDQTTNAAEASGALDELVMPKLRAVGSPADDTSTAVVLRRSNNLYCMFAEEKNLRPEMNVTVALHIEELGQIWSNFIEERQDLCLAAREAVKAYFVVKEESVTKNDLLTLHNQGRRLEANAIEQADSERELPYYNRVNITVDACFDELILRGADEGLLRG